MWEVVGLCNVLYYGPLFLFSFGCDWKWTYFSDVISECGYFMLYRVVWEERGGCICVGRSTPYTARLLGSAPRTHKTQNKMTFNHHTLFLSFFWRISPQWARASSFTRFLDHTQRHTTVSRISLDDGSARRRERYLTKHNTHTREISMSPVGFEPTISTGKRPQDDALDRAATGTGSIRSTYPK